jgi:hypothetical protein
MIAQCKKALPIQGKKLRQTTTIAKKSLPRLAHHFHQPITKAIAIHKSTREKLAKDSENFSPILLQMGELCFKTRSYDLYLYKMSLT